ncbi:hypothetical protein HDU81_001363, partial [Chytriomyces hyalinus]
MVDHRYFYLQTWVTHETMRYGIAEHIEWRRAAAIPEKLQCGADTMGRAEGDNTKGLLLKPRSSGGIKPADLFDHEDDHDDGCSESEHEESLDEDDSHDEFGVDSECGTHIDGSLKPFLSLNYGGYWPHDWTPSDCRAITLLRIVSNHRFESFQNDIDVVMDLVDRRLSIIPQLIRTRKTFNEESLRMIFYGVHQTLYFWQFIDSDCRLEVRFDDELGNKFVDVVMTSSVGCGCDGALIELKYANERYIDGNEALDTMSNDDLLDVSYTFDGTNKTTMR